MYKLCKTEQSAQRQRMLEEGLLSAMKTKRYEEISISDLCDQMGIPRKSFYRYFSSKDGALHALIDHTLMDFEQYTNILPGRNLGDIHRDLCRYFEFWKLHGQLLDALERSGLSGVLVQRAISQVQKEFVLPRSPAVTEQQQLHAVTFFICGMMSLVVRWHRAGCIESPAEMAQLTAVLLTKPLLQV